MRQPPWGIPLLALFGNNLLPVFLAAAAGYTAARTLSVDPRPVSRLAFFVFAPCLIFRILVDSRLDGVALARMVGFASTSLLLLAGVAGVAARALGASRPQTAAIVLVALLPNAGNFGLSVNLFAWGEAGLAHAGAYFLTSAVLSFTLGIVVVSLGRQPVGKTLVGLLRVPAIWAVVAALGLLESGWQLPLPLDRTVRLLSEATIPLFLVVLGIQLHGKGVRAPWRWLLTACGIRLVGGALVGLLLSALFGLEGVARQAAAVQSAMPTAVITSVLATEYDCEPGLVTAAVVVTTLACPLTLTPLLAWLGAS